MWEELGQLLVVAHHTDTSPSLCYEPELIPDCWYVPDKLRTGASNLGSVRDIGILDNNQLAHWSLSNG